jgi:death-on-curing family protein
MDKQMNGISLRPPALSPELLEQYERDARAVLKFPSHGEPQGFVDAIDVLRSHYVVVDFCISERIGEGVGGIGPRNYDLLLSAVDRQFVSFGETAKWTTIFERTATLVFGLIKNHPFHDANKRTALLSLVYSLYINGRYITADKNELEDLLVYIADDSLHLIDGFEKFEGHEDSEVHFVSEYFRRHSREVDKRTYIITYRELDRRLRHHGYEPQTRRRISSI